MTTRCAFRFRPFMLPNITDTKFLEFVNMIQKTLLKVLTGLRFGVDFAHPKLSILPLESISNRIENESKKYKTIQIQTVI